MSLRLKKQTLRDESLEHQVVLSVQHGGNGAVMVSCNCWRVPHSGSRPTTFLPMGEAPTLEDTKRIYNTPENHSKPFDVEEWGLKW